MDGPGRARSGAPTARRWPTSLRSLESRSYRQYFVGNFVSTAGQWMQRLAQDWLVLELTSSPRALGITLAMQFTPVLLGALWGGTIVDRSDLRRVLLLTQAASMVLALGLAFLTLTNLVELWMVWVFAASLGVVTVFDNPARHSLIMEMVDRDHIPNAVALNSAGHNLGRLAGPAVGGIIIGVVDVGAAFLINAVSFVPMLVAVYIADIVVREKRMDRESRSHDLVDGLRYVWSHVEIRTSLLLMLILSVFAQNYRVLLPGVAIATFGGGASLYGTFLALMGGGALLGGIFSMYVRRPTLRLIMAAGGAFGALSLLVPLSGSLVVVATVLVAMGLANSVFNISARSMELLRVDVQYRGRVMALHQMAFLGGTPVGGLLVGEIAERRGVTAGFLVAGTTIILGFVLVYAAVARRLAREHRVISS